MCNEINLENAILFLDGNSGVYIPKVFCECLNGNEVNLSGLSPSSLDECFEICRAGPEHEHYWDAWNDLESNLIIEKKECGTKYMLHQDSDLWLVPVK